MINSITEYISKTIDLSTEIINSIEVPVVAILLNTITNEHSVYTNLVYSSNDPTAHAEIMGIRSECSKNNSSRLDDYYMFVNLEPCVMCAQAISNARIKRLYFAAYDTKSGGVENGARLYYQKSCHYKPEFYGGILASQAEKILSEYFRNIRLRKSSK